jgi:ribosomal protein S18 acetylase RimI-like enzyme
MMTIGISNPAVSLRTIRATDVPALCAIYGSTREEELKSVPHWTEEMRKAFVEQQFQAQHEYYQKNYLGAFFGVLEKEQRVIGRLYIKEDFMDREIRIIDITLLPPWRGLGIGTGLLQDVMSYAVQLQRPMTIHVESFNPAKMLYERLGFKKISETNGVYHLMEWRPSTQPNATI